MVWSDISRVRFHEKMLWACVLRRSIFDHVLYRGLGKHKMKWHQAHKFIFGDQDESEYSLTFEQICGLFGWEPDYLRRKVKELDRTDIKKLEAMKFKECFDEEASAIFLQGAHWKSGQTVPFFVSFNYSQEFRNQMQLRLVATVSKQRLKSIPRWTKWSFCAA